jgi:hypothetical protein
MPSTSPVLTAMTATQTKFPVAQSIYEFKQHGQSGAWLSSLLPHTAKVADKLCFIKSMHTEQINHDPGITFLQTGFQLAGRPSIGSWLAYGLGSENKDLPAYIVRASAGSKLGDQPLDLANSPGGWRTKRTLPGEAHRCPVGWREPSDDAFFA